MRILKLSFNKFIFFFLFTQVFLILCNLNISHAALLEVSSKYNLGSTIKKTKGTGFLIGYDCLDNYSNDTLGLNPLVPRVYNTCNRIFLLTAAHITQGSNEISIHSRYKQQLNNSDIIGRLADNWLDLEILELRPDAILNTGIRPLLRCRTDLVCFNLFKENTDSIQYVFNGGLENINYINTWWAVRFGYVEASKIHSLWKKLNFIAVVNTKPTIPFYEDSVNIYRWTYNNTRLILPHSIIPGMSGALLLANPFDHQPIDENVKILAGIGIQNDDDFHESIYVANIGFESLLKKYISKQQRGRTENSPQWFNNKSTYRIWSEKSDTYPTVTYPNFSEQSLQLTNTDGNGGSVDMDGNTLTAQSNKTYSADLIWNETPLISHKVLGFKYSDKPLRAIWASMPSLQFVLDKENSTSSKLTNKLILEDSPHFIELLLNKAKNPFVQNENEKSVHKQKMNACEINIVKTSDNIDFISVKLKLSNSLQTEQNQISFLLNSKAQLIDSVNNKVSPFSPRFTLNSKNNDHYIVDIRQLFFTDLYEIHSETENGFDHSANPLELAKKEKPIIKLRNLTKNSQTILLPCLFIGEKTND